MAGFIHGSETHALLSACFAVYKDKGCGFLEAVFQECLELEPSDRNIPFQSILNLSWNLRDAFKNRPISRILFATIESSLKSKP
jgi:PD-(D/E)XK nuclease superfamily